MPSNEPSEQKSNETPKRRWARAGGLALGLAFALLSGAGAVQAQRPQRDPQLVTKSLWWNDPVIIQAIELTEAQRAKMDAAYERYEQKAEAARKNRGGQRDFVEALEAGQWDRARTLLDTWADVRTNPQYAMGEMKLELLQLLSKQQLGKLVKDYPRVVRRQWRPAVNWGDRTAGPGAKPFHGGMSPHAPQGGGAGPGGAKKQPGGMQ